MTFRRALVLAPLAVTVAIAAHFLGFGVDHALGGSHGAEFLTVGLGGSVLLALAAVLWLGLSECDADRGAQSLLRLLPGGGATPLTAAVLASSGFVALAAGEVLEGRSPFGTWASALALALVATLIAAGARQLARWLAARGAAFAKLIAAALRPIAQPCSATSAESRLPAASAFVRGPRRGRAPPHLA